MTYPKDKRVQKFISGFRPAVYARQGRMLGIRQPLDGPVFDTLEDAQNWCMYAMIDHFDRRLGMADAKIHPFKGVLDFGPPPDPARLRETQRVVAEVAEERRRDGKPPPGQNWRVKAISERLGEVFILRPLF
ncbi:MAG TPA: hypothetical protein VF019_07705 [Nitrospira sp.]